MSKYNANQWRTGKKQGWRISLLTGKAVKSRVGPALFISGFSE
jgi:hypothetical protein